MSSLASASPHAAVTPRTDNATIAPAAFFLIIAGLAFVILALALPDLLAAFYQLVASPGTATSMDAAARLGAGLFGAITVGWGVMLQQLSRGVAPARALLVGVVAWFVVDSGTSVLLGYAWNALSNVAFVLVIGVLLRRR